MPAGPLTLRRRLLAIVIVLLAAVSAVVGVISVGLLHVSLVDRVDTQLVRSLDRGLGGFDVLQAPGASVGDAGLVLRVPGQAPGTIGVLVAGGLAVSSGYLDEAGEVVRLDAEQQAALAGVGAGGPPRTVSLGELGDYRALATAGPGELSIVLALPLGEVQATTTQLAVTIAVVALAGIALAIALGSALIGVSLAPLGRLTQTARHVSELPLDRGEVALAERVPEGDPGSEVGQLSAAFNRMLGHVASALSSREASEQKVRRFVADASHELRTPLASIRGYAELTRRSGEELPTDAAYALDRIESESVRMSELVEDLLLLARLDEGRGLDRRAVDIGGLVAHAVNDARAAGPDHLWELEAPASLEVTGDEGRLRQVVANLLANARVHTPAGTTVRTALAADGDAIRLTVADDGPGVDSALRDTVFERFARGDSSRSRAAGSTGLGLAIVRGIVLAHGGAVSLVSEPGETAFTVTLPRGSA